MSTGNLCKAKVKFSRYLNVSNEFTCECDLYEGHEGEHSSMFYHVHKEGQVTLNYRLGRLTWDDKYSTPPAPGKN